MIKVNTMTHFALKPILACIDTSDKQTCRILASLFAVNQECKFETSIIQLDQLLDKIAGEMLQTDIGLSAANMLTERDFIDAGIEFRNCYSTMMLCELSLKLQGLLSVEAGYQLQISDEIVTLSFSLEPGEESAYRARCELLIFSIYQLLHRVTGLNPMGLITQVCFSFLKPSYYREYSKLLSCPINYSDQTLAICLDAKILHTVFQQMSNQRIIRQSNKPSEVSKLCGAVYQDKVSVVSRIRRYYQEGKAPLALRVTTKVAMADMLGLSVSSLTRKLADEGTSYMQVVDEIKLSKARQLLADTELTIDLIASELGFTSRKGFELAFIRWQSMTPYKFRKTHGKAVSLAHSIYELPETGASYSEVSQVGNGLNNQDTLTNSQGSVSYALKTG